MQEPNGTRSPVRSLVGFSLGLVLLGAVVAWPEAALAEVNPYYDKNAAEGDIVDVCKSLEIEASGVLKGRCNKVDTKTKKITTVFDEIDLSPDIDDACFGTSLYLAVYADEITLTVKCPAEGGRIISRKSKLDDMIGWNTETGQFYGKDEDLIGQ